MMFCLVRTDQRREKAGGHLVPSHRHERHRALPFAPIITLDEDHEVNEVFFEDVKVPVGESGRRGKPRLDLRKISARARAHRHCARRAV